MHVLTSRLLIEMLLTRNGIYLQDNKNFNLYDATEDVEWAVDVLLENANTNGNAERSLDLWDGTWQVRTLRGTR